MIRKIITAVVRLWIFWILLSASIKFPFVLAGLVGAVVLTSVSYYFLGKNIILAEWNFGVFVRWVKFIFSCMDEIIRANIDVAECVLDPKLPINPSMVKIKTPFKDNEFLFTLLANVITLTPGTLTVDYEGEGEYIYVHFLDEVYIESLSQRNLPMKVAKVFAPARGAADKVPKVEEGVVT